MVFYIRNVKREERQNIKAKFTEFLFLSKKQKLNITLLRILKKNVFGISLKRFLCIFLALVGCGYSTKVSKMKEKYILYIQKLLRKSRLNNELKEFIKRRRKRKWFLNIYMSKRQKQGLPSRGQRTKTNAQTVKNLKIEYLKTKNITKQKTKKKKNILKKMDFKKLDLKKKLKKKKKIILCII